MKERFDKVKKEDFIIRIRPYMDKEGSWNGDIDVAIITQPENNLEDEDYFQVMHFCKMIASSIPVMELNEDFRELVHDYVVEKVDNNTEVEVEDKPKVLNEDGNVVEIDFKTKTKGNA
tara:strand:- start:310 stop:663 length:354 start_codon:yes stop_codon:yes gene_type:complete